MSKYIKYISSDHFGAPIMKGDRWGYCVEMLRKCLVEGFNEHTDLIRAEVIDVDKVKYTFTTPHNYVANQTIKISNISFPELNGDVFIISSDANSVTCKPYTNVSGMVGQVIDNITAKAIVAPLGFKEKFKDGNRSVFVTDEDTENAYFYIDDTEPSSGWKAANGNTNLISPLVFMCDKMSDIDTVTGRNIMPYDINAVDNYKTRGYTYSGQLKNGIWNFLTFGILSTNDFPNNATEQAKPIKYNIIGNGRIFYFLPTLNSGNSGQTRTLLYGYGKINTIVSSDFTKNYMLIANQQFTNRSVFSYERLYYNDIVLPITNISQIAEAGRAYPTKTGTNWYGILDVKGDTKSFRCFTTNVNMATNIILISGNIGSYPNQFDKKYYISKIRMYIDNDYYGDLSGLMWTHNSANLFFVNGSIIKSKYNNKDKYLFVYNEMMNTNPQLAIGYSVPKFIYNISLDYSDWNNYE